MSKTLRCSGIIITQGHDEEDVATLIKRNWQKPTLSLVTRTAGTSNHQVAGWNKFRVYYQVKMESFEQDLATAEPSAELSGECHHTEFNHIPNVIEQTNFCDLKNLPEPPGPNYETTS